MSDELTPSEFLEIIAGFLRQTAIPLLPPHAAFEARVAANALDLVRRQLDQPGCASRAEQESLAALLNENGSPAALQQRLCAAIADQSITPLTPGLSAYLWRATMAKLAVDQPSYAAYRRELGRKIQLND